MPSPDAVRLRHMREAAATALEMAAGHDRADLSTNTVLAMALTRCLEILGEAAGKISPDVCAKFPAIPFPKIISMRNRLIHAYFDVNLDIVWTTVSDDLPALSRALDEALAAVDR
jgi:uncharacterized protein with HEPN domain